MIRKPLVEQIHDAVKSGTLPSKFSAKDVRKKIKGFADSTYDTFLPKHRKGNPGNYNEYFKRISSGMYSVI